MPLTPEEVSKIAHLARLNLSHDEEVLYANQLSGILEFIEQLNQVDTEQKSERQQTKQIEPLAHPFDLEQRLRDDAVTEVDLREKYQKIASQTEAGLYLVPQVIE